ncbi:MAG: amino acid adenylation domain-containing protein, partial [bacterium]|nr:amino acid adenylation domain-containing protein [bacterium]
YMLSKERLLHLLPREVKTLGREEMIQKYDSYFPQDIKAFSDILQLGRITDEEFREVGGDGNAGGAEDMAWVPDEAKAAPRFVENIRPFFPPVEETGDALRILFLDLSQFFTRDSGGMLYDMVEEPLGLMYLLTHLNRTFGNRVWGKIAKSRIDFDNFEELRELIFDFRPHMIGIRTLSYYKEFFHRSVSLMRGWGLEVPIIAGGPYASSDYHQMLQDGHVNLAVLGEGESTMAHLVEKIIANDNHLPTEDELMDIPGIAFIKEEERRMLNRRKREIIFMDHITEALEKQPVENPVAVNNDSHLLYLISTSGSTGKPKSVMLEHRNLVNLLHFEFSDPRVAYDKVLQFASIGFDVSAQEIFSALLYGGELYLIHREMRHDLTALLDYIRENRVRVLFLPPAFLKLVFEDPEYADLFPEGVQHIIAAGEQLIVPERFRRYLDTHGVYLHNHYGPAETHVVTALTMAPSDGKPEKPSIGKPVANNRVLVMDEHLNLKPLGVVGEIYISGANVGRGYYNRDDLTAEKYLPNPYIEGERMYRTGDLGRWFRSEKGEEIEFLGRKDYQVKVRGFRIELEEIEKHLVKIDFIKEAVVLMNETGTGEKYLSAFLVCEGIEEEELAELRDILARSLPDYMIPSYYKKIDKIPVNASGKVDRRALRSLEPGQSGKEYLGPETPLEEELVEIWAGVLKKERGSIGVEDNVFDLGGHSLNGTILLAKIHKKMQARIPLAELFEKPTVRGLAEFISNGREESYESIEPAPKMEYYPLSSAQKRLFLLDQFQNIGISYNLPDFFKIKSPAEAERMLETFKKLIQRHESLRTSFELIDNQPVQRIHEQVDFKIEYYDSDVDPSTFVRPFDLSRAPLLRAGLVLMEAECLLLLDMHHIITDGTSIEIFRNDFLALYEGEELEPLKLHYKDFAWWQNSEKARSLIATLETYWLKVFGADIPVLNIPVDYARPLVQSYEGSSVDFELEPAVVEKLNRVAGGQDATQYMMLLAVFNVLLFKLSGQEDIVVGTPTAGRSHTELERVIGMFVNTLALRNYPGAGKPFNGFLRNVRETTLQAFENQDYQFEELVDRLAITRDISRNPLFDVMFALHNQNETRWNVPGADSFENVLSSLYESKIAGFDLELHGREIGGRLYFSLLYSTKLFKKETMPRFVNYYKKILSKVVENPEIVLSHIDIITEEEKKQVLYEFNDTGAEFPQDKTIHQLFKEQAARTPDHIAVVDHRFYKTHMTYSQLDKASNCLAHNLLQNGAGPVGIVGLLVERSMEMIAGLLGILKAGCAYVPLNPKAPAARNEYMLSETGTCLLLTTGSLYEEDKKIRSWEDKTYFIEELLSSSHLLNFPSSQLLNSSSLCYVIFTSGSTGKPKGVPISHSNLSPLLHWGYKHLGLGPSDRAIQNLSYYFDWSVWEIFITLTTGAGLYMVPDEMLLDPGVCIPFMKKNGITVLHATPSRYLHFIDTGQKLETLTYLFLGAEKLTVDVLKRSFKSVDEDCRVFNMYGPTEATIIAAVLEIEREDIGHFKYLTSVPIGVPVGNAGLLVLDRYMNLCPVNVVGELYIGGDGVSKGYLNSPELTSEKFLSTPLYATGDLARWLPDGTVEFLGRIDHQVKVRGYRIELGEIESQLLTHPGVKEAIVMDREDEKEDKYLCAYIVPHSPHSPHSTNYREYLSQNLPDYMIPSYFVQIETIPLNPNGKLDRKALPEPEVKTGTGYTAPRSQLEKKMTALWSGVLNHEPVGIDDNFFELGGHSLKATMLVSKVHKEFNVKVTLIDVFTSPTIRELSQYIEGTAADRYTPLRPVEKRAYYPLSSAQKRLYLLQIMEENNTVYNMPQVLPLDPAIDIEKLEETFKVLIRRHESLRTSFHMIEDVPVQKIHDSVEFRITAIPTPYPFNLSQAPLLRVGVINPAEGTRLLVMDMHHIITDGVSQDILTREFIALYQGEHLPPLKLQYKDYAVWQNSEIEQEALEQQEAWWREMFSAEVPVPSLPTDYPRPAVQSFEGAYTDFLIDKEVTVKLKALALEEGITLFMLLLSIFNVLLSKLSGMEDIIVGTPVAGRRHADLISIIGMFVNTLALRNRPAGGTSFAKFLQEVKKRTLEAFENQDYPFEDLVEKVSVKRDAGRNPLFDVMFAMDGMDGGEEKECQMTQMGIVSPGMESGTGTAKFDLVLSAGETGEELACTFEYCTRLFKKQTINRFITYFKKIVSSIVADLDIRLSRLEIITEEEKSRILYDFNNRETEYSEDRTICQLFAEQVLKTPSSNAVTFDGEKLTFKQLDERSRRLAGYLRMQGGNENEPVGILVNRSLEMIVGILGILNAGCAYVPLNPKAPAARSQYILEECGARLLLTTSSLSAWIAFEQEILYMDEVSDVSTALPAQITKPDHVAYVIFTSGSTGKPKGVPITHSNLSPLLHWGYKHLGIGSSDRVIQNLSYYFDWSAWEIFITLTTGAGLYMVPDEMLLNPGVCIPFMNENRITVLHVTPSQYLYFINAGQKLETLTYLFLGAEKLTVDVLKRSFKTVEEDCRVFNMYGPTEATIIAAVLEIEREDKEHFRYLTSVPIGVPVGNTRLLILDRYMNLCPVNVVGELYIGGDGVSRGYLNSPEQTVQTFNRSYKSYMSSVFYKTGDTARWLSDGTVEFLGRIDHQVKIRGHRIELGEIESQLSIHPEVKETVVLDRGNEKEEKYLCAYFVSQSTGPAFVSKLREYLSQNLPDYMIPSYFIQIETIPLNPNGKLDRKALPEPGDGDTAVEEFIAPRDETEERLLEIWRKVLGRDGISIDADFFESGGHSLTAAVMISKINREFMVSVPLVQIFSTPTIRELGAFLKDAPKESGPLESRHLVRLKEGAQPHLSRLFLVHDGSGEVEGYVEFCRRLDPGIDCWGIRAGKFRGIAPRNITVDELAQIYVKEITQVQSHGPYSLAGWSLGGTVAFEMALQLEKMGETVSFLGLIDSPGPSLDSLQEAVRFSKESESTWLREYLPGDSITEKIKEISGIEEIWSKIVAYVEETGIEIETVKRFVPGYLAQMIPGFDRLGHRELIFTMNVIRTLANARTLYIPREKLNAVLYYFKARESPEIFNDNWQKYCNAPIKLREIEGSHFSILKMPRVEQTARIFNYPVCRKSPREPVEGN